MPKVLVSHSLVIAFLFIAACGTGGAGSQAPVQDDASTDTPDTSPPPPDPRRLPFTMEREPAGEPLGEAELTAFTTRLADFYGDREYLGWLLRMSHGVAAETNRRDFRMWWTETHAVKDGDLVTMVHDPLSEHGGHNSLVANAKILSAAAGAYLLTGTAIARTLTEQYCKGITATMLGMVYDEDDPLPHLMARSVVMMNHEYMTHDGRRKAVDYENWFFPYDRWNCSRFLYSDNPYWDRVWVTNTRSKDDLGYLYHAAAVLPDVIARGTGEPVHAACAETLALLRAFAADIVENGYEIRTKDSQGNAYTPSNTTGPPEANTGDLASFVIWDPLFPESECNHMQATELLAYGPPAATNCAPLGGNSVYEVLAIENNPPNGHVFRFFHIAAIHLALHSGDDERARQALQGLEERFARDLALDLTNVRMAPARWYGELAINRLAAAAVGYPLTANEVREIHALFDQALASYDDWPLWDLWDPAVPAGEHRWVPPHTTARDDGTTAWWVPPHDLGLFFSYCASPFRNPQGEPPVDCAAF